MTGDEWSTSATFCDLNNDGHLDLFVANYINSDNLFACRSGAGELDYCGPNAYRGVPDQLYRNNGDGTFTFTPNENFNGEATLNFKVSDGTATVELTATVGIAPVNDAPVISSPLAGREDEPLTVRHQNIWDY